MKRRPRRRKGGWRIPLGATGLLAGAVVTLGLGWLVLVLSEQRGWFDLETSLGLVGFTLFCFVPIGAALGCYLGVIMGARFDKDVPSGHCPCGYDRRGNVSGTCPECGQPFEPKGDAP